MSWIESHQSLSKHRKTTRLAALLKADRHKVIGHLHEMWWWGLDNADVDGGLAGLTEDEIAMGAEWPTKDAKRFVCALVEAGFLEAADGGYVLHDWYAYAGKLNTKRAANRDRMKRARAEHVQRTTDARAAHVHTLPTVPNQPNQPAANAASEHAAAAGALEDLPEVHDDYRKICDAWFVATGTTLPPATAERFEAKAEKLGLATVLAAIRETGDNGAKSPKYTLAILEHWESEGRTGPDEKPATPPRVISKIPNPFFDGFTGPPPPPRKAATS